MIDDIVTQLGTCTELQQVVRADSLVSAAVDTPAIMNAYLKNTVAGRMYPLRQPAGAQFPNIVAQRVAGKPGFYEGYPLLRTDIFVLSLRDKAYPGLVGLASTVAGLVDGYGVAGEAGAMEVSDTAVDYEYDQKTYRADLEVMVNHLAAASQVVPFAAVFLQGGKAGDLMGANILRQREQVELVVLSVVPGTDIETVRDASIATLLGYTPPGARESITYNEGRRLDVVGGLTVWRDSYRLGRLLSAS